MRVGLYLDSGRVFRWHLWLVEAVKAIPDTNVFVVFSHRTRPLPSTCMMVFDLESRLYGTNGSNALDKIDLNTMPRRPIGMEGPLDVLIDCAGDATLLPAANRVLTPFFNHVTGEVGAIAALM